LQERKFGAKAIVVANQENVWSLSTIKEISRCVDKWRSASECYLVCMSIFLAASIVAWC